MKYFLFVIFLLNVACNEAAKTTKTTKESSPSIEVADLPSISEAEILNLFEESDYVDYIFYDLAFSMSYDNKNSIQSFIRWIQTTTPDLSADCKPLARMIFQRQGDQMIEADLYISTECSHIIWVKDGKKTNANTISPKGKEHFFGIIKQFSK